MSRSTVGYRKRQKGLACEDAVLTKEYDDFCLMACADGHGDAKCKYARRGAELATRISARIVCEMRESVSGVEELGKELNDGREQLFERLVCEWVGAVLDDYRVAHREDLVFQEQYMELARYARRIFEIRDGEMPIREFRDLAQYRNRLEEAIYRITRLYGTTLHVVVVTSKFVFAFGIGDGDVISVNQRRVEWLLPTSDHFSVSSASMCERFGSILQDFHAVFVPVTRGRTIADSRFQPELVLIATDGLRNGFLSDEAFIEKILEIADCFKKGNGYLFQRHSRRWIEERSEFGVTQDDVSFVLCTKYSLKNNKK